MIRSAQFAIRKTGRLPWVVPTSLPKVPLVTTRTQASSADASEYEQIMRMGVYSSSASKSPSMSRAYGASSVQSGSAQQAVSSTYRSVTEPTLYEDYDRYEMHHRPSESTQLSYYDVSYDPSLNGGEAGSVI